MGFFKKLLGGDDEKKKKKDKKDKPAAQAAAPRVDDKKSDAEREYEKMQAYIQQCEAEGLDLAGLDKDDLVGYHVKTQLLSMAQADGKTEEEAVMEQGFQSKKHYRQVSNYFMYRCTELKQKANGKWETKITDAWNNAGAEAGMKAIGMMQQNAAAADPALLEPVNGVTVEQWAGAAATMGTLGADATPDQVAEALGKFGLDRATYDAAQAGWMAKMQSDTTGAISQKYAEGFAVAQGVDTSAEPCTFEYYMEIMVAQEAWANSGKDVNAELQNVFGITAIDYSNYSQYWSMKYATDMALIRKGDALREKFLAKYSTAGMDDDLSL